jgi:hypothetical protein
VQVTPHNLEVSIIFGKGVTSAKPDSAGNLVLALDDLDAARAGLISRGVEVSEVLTKQTKSRVFPENFFHPPARSVIPWLEPATFQPLGPAVGKSFVSGS